MSAGVLDTSAVGLTEDQTHTPPEAVGSRVTERTVNPTAMFVKYVPPAVIADDCSAEKVPKWVSIVLNPAWAVLSLIAAVVGGAIAASNAVYDGLAVAFLGATLSTLLLVAELYIGKKLQSKEK
jgi:hypothetical protein